MDVGTYGSQLGSVFTTIWDSIVNVIPGIIAAIIILLLGYFLGWLLFVIIEKALVKLKLDKWVVEETGLKKVIGKFKLSHFLAIIAKWYVFILFFPPAAEAVNLMSFSKLLIDLSLWIPNLIAAVVIAILGILIANYLKLKIEHVSFHNSRLVASMSQVIVLIFTFLVALEQLGIDISVASNSFLIILSGVVLSLALGFGLGMKSEAAKIVKKWRKKL